MPRYGAMCHLETFEAGWSVVVAESSGIEPPPVTITTAAGEKIDGKLAYRDEFTITLIDSEGWSRSWPATGVKIDGEDPLQAHTGQLGKYTEEEIHNVFAFLETLK